MTTKSGLTVSFDKDGFLVDTNMWNEEVAEAVAREEDVEELTEQHWQVIFYLRKYYEKYNIAPMVRRLCTETGYSLKQLYDLFPTGPAKGACKIAGLPKPTGCV
ncbi:TusE/DsrC/DsvC family sulfur relay protein [Heliorestis acidaminivorans]|uniref:TusE/DsrC/DsvC family sulfur relay protein n=1 Tax=Heliorestis acidaminivorans TaxID=553427 RepID=A0A6I0EXB6_9FIRM|nr:TusE/DsrC/DsvC family sulfur relay protein [Heliorestis acidaminivorans]